jgi:hypothetical protein
MKRWIVALVVFILILAGAAAYIMLPNPHTSSNPNGPAPTSFIECEKQYPVSQSYPRTCTTQLGVSFTEDIGNTSAMTDSITVETPRPNDTVSSPIVINGKARGTYYYEGTFPVEVHAADGTVVGQGIAEAQGAWTTTDFVRFKGTITFTKPNFGATGTLVFKNDNPSGDPSNQKELDIPVQF